MSLVPVSISHPPALAFDLQELCCGIKECQYWMPQAALHIHHVQVPSWMEMDAGIQPRRDHELIFILTPIQEDTYHVFSLHRIMDLLQIAIQNGHLCHVRRSVCDIIGGQPKTN